ncbi:MAG: ATP-binding cassette domain-containing protein [Chitinophagales bacterium]|nr:ATP-binding cassette domain-containing protein [Chitinophagales bacterium]
MQNDIAIRVKGLSKVYQKKNKNGDQEDFYALKDVNFEVKKGEVVGIIGKNGSGKSTLLKILSGVTKPTTGSVEINGTVASILDVGTGFHADLSGRENVYLRGKLLGMSTPEIDEAFDDIVNFSEIGDFIDTPVKNYSSGMFLRLAFSILVFLKCDILLLDEVMAVGDIGFREKSKQQLFRNFKKKTILIVSHQVNEIVGLLNSTLLINRGNLLKTDTKSANFHSFIQNLKLPLKEGEISSLKIYRGQEANSTNPHKFSYKLIGKKDNNFYYHEEIGFNVRFASNKDVLFGFSLKDLYSNTIFEKYIEVKELESSLTFTIPNKLLNIGFYSIDFFIFDKTKIHTFERNALTVNVIADGYSEQFLNKTWGVIKPEITVENNYKK